jgi:predicted permease
MRVLLRKLGARLDRGGRSSALEEEIAFHVEMLTRDEVESGKAPEAARAAALRKFGNRTKVAEEARDTWSFGMVDRLLRDARIGVRTLCRAPAFALVATSSLALGIGLSTAVFTVADALLLRPLPVLDQDRLVVLWGENRDQTLSHDPLRIDDANEFARRTRVLEQVAFVSYYGALPQPVYDGDRITRIRRSMVSGNFFDVLGTKALLGRALRASDDANGAPPVAVLSYATWHERFGGDPRILGRQLRSFDDGRSYTIVGVMPQGLEYPSGTDFWAPIAAPESPEQRSFILLDVVGRLHAGSTAADAERELSAFFERPEATSWTREHLAGSSRTLPRLIVGDVRPALFVFAAAAGLLLLITCINIANLLLVRGFARMREVAVRSALGAARGQIIAQLLTENALIAAAGGMLGVAVATGAVRSFIAFAPAGIPRLDEIHVNAAALLGAVAITGCAMLVFAIAPAVLTSRVELQRALRSDRRQSGGSRSRIATEALVVGQIALAVLVLAAAGLIVRSLMKLESAKLAFDPSHLLVAELAIRFDEYQSVTKQTAMLEELVDRLRTLPGVRGASPVVAVPFSGTSGWDGRPVAEGQTSDEAASNPWLNVEVVAPGYFETLGMPIMEGRGFTTADRGGAPDVVVLSESAAKHYWPGADAVGKHLRAGPPKSARDATVVGVVSDTRYRSLRDARASIYFPVRQSTFPFAPLTLVIRTGGRPAELIPTLRRVIGETSAGVALASAAPFETYLDGPLAQPRLDALLISMFAVAAVVIAAVGLFGVIATMVRQRTGELGIRMALGATASELQRMVVRRGLAMAMVGVVAGLVAALLANRLLSVMLYEVSPADGATLAAVAGLIVVVGLVASYVPARRVTLVDPARVLNAE